VTFVLFWIILKLGRCFFSDFIGQDAQGLSGLQRTYVVFGGAFELIESIKGFCDSCADYHDAVIAHDHDLLFGISQKACATLALFLEREAAVVVINDVTIEERRAVLVDR
jgi:hypothetical protein